MINSELALLFVWGFACSLQSVWVSSGLSGFLRHPRNMPVTGLSFITLCFKVIFFL